MEHRPLALVTRSRNFGLCCCPSTACIFTIGSWIPRHWLSPTQQNPTRESQSHPRAQVFRPWDAIPYILIMIGLTSTFHYQHDLSVHYQVCFIPIFSIYKHKVLLAQSEILLVFVLKMITLLVLSWIIFLPKTMVRYTHGNFT